MSTRYLALAHPDSTKLREMASCARDVDPTLEIVIDTNYFALLIEKSGKRVMSAERSTAIVGSLFSNTGSLVEMRSLSTAANERIHVTRGVALTRDYWGGYVGFILLDDESLIVVRDPSATMPCYYMKSMGGLLLGSDMGTILSVGIEPPAIDWTSLAWFVQTPGYWSHSTCLQDVKELPRGWQLCSRDGEVTELTDYWSPWTFASKQLMLDDDDGVEALRHVVEKSVAASASRFPRIVLRLSGGLDSSIVAACLARSGAQFSCLNFATDDPAGDERSYARAVAKYVGVQLHEVSYNADFVDFGRSLSQHLPRPISRPSAQHALRVSKGLARHEGATAVFTGGGGDDVFYSVLSAGPIADSVLLRGLGSKSWATLNDVCRARRCTYGNAMLRTAESLVRTGGRYRWQSDIRFMHAGRPPAVAPDSHPVLASPQSVLPGKVGHVARLWKAHNFVSELSKSTSDIAWVSPLLAQPVIELCLRIPTWRWCLGGRDRAVARQAFAGILPSEIIARTWKGRPSESSHALFVKARNTLKEILLEGRLVSEGLVSREQIDSYLNDPTEPKNPDYLRLMEFAEVEAWISCWSGRSRRSSAAAPVRARA